MGFFKNRTTWSTLEMGIVKLSLLSAGILIGVYGFEALKNYLAVFWIIAVFFGVASILLWYKKSREH